MPKPPKAKPSKYMLEIVRLNFVDLVKRVDANETKNRVAALKTMRRHLTKQFMTVYKAFREKRYGETFDRENY